jgi:hypothetical protein
MGKLYAVEKEAREAGATPQERLAMRQQRSVAPLEELKLKITQIALHALPRANSQKPANTPSTSGRD